MITVDKRELLTKLKKFFIKYGSRVDYVLLFGSLSKNTFTSVSDLDIAIKPTEGFEEYFEKKLPLIICELALYLNINEDFIDITILKLDNDYSYSFLYNIFKEGEIIYCRDRRKYIDDLVKVSLKYADYLIQLKKHRAVEKYVKKYTRGRTWESS
ncbi:MAG: hypothetical protein DRJ52_04200 [Thermoprotei archaeon]|nr:MAG: hypothetical protein DRJ52_04200 [Thermoprotei archaeon]HDI75008.1 nucleotidyltransferase domain-containing protein [Thermoprotei archaeon]